MKLLDERLRHDPDLTPDQAKVSALFVDDILTLAFPCIFAARSLHDGFLFAVFCDDWDDFVTQHLDILEKFLHETDPNDPTACAIFIAGQTTGLNQSIAQFWQALDAMLALPSSQVDEDGVWSTNNTELFFTFHSDTYARRKSRRISAGDMIVVQRKSNLDLIGTADRRQSRSFELIRRKIAAYDAVSLSPLLGTTQNIPMDWAQFALDDDNAITLQTFKCPYRNSGQNRNTSRASSL